MNMTMIGNNLFTSISYVIAIAVAGNWSQALAVSTALDIKYK